jgi:hypothetical protein
METRVRNRPVWPYVLAVILLIILALLVMRNCRQDRGYDEGVPPMVPYTDTLETDTTMRSPDEGYGPYDTAGTGDRTDTADPSDRNPGDTVVDPTAPARPQATPPLPGTGSPSMPAGTPGGAMP